MKEFLTLIKIIQNQTIELEVSKKDFIKAFKHNIGEQKSELYEVLEKTFKTKKSNYIGKIDFNEFYLKKRNHFFDTDKNTSVVKGKFIQRGQYLRIITEIQGVSYFKFAIYAILAIGYSCIMFVSSQNILKKTGNYLYLVLFVVFHSSIIFGLPYFIIKKRIKRMETEMNYNFIIWSKIVSSIEE